MINSLPVVEAERGGREVNSFRVSRCGPWAARRKLPSILGLAHMALLNCALVTHGFSLCYTFKWSYITHKFSLGHTSKPPLISISSDDFSGGKKNLPISEVTFSLYNKVVTRTKFCYCLHFFFMPEAHGKSGN